MEKQELIDFETVLADLIDEGELPYLVHLSGGNEDQLIEIFKEIKSGDYIFSTHRSHYHYLLAGGSPDKLKQMVLNGNSMFVFDRHLNFFTSSIVAGNVGIAVGVALALKKKGSSQKVWCFVGDGAEDEGHFYEAVRYAWGHQLPCTFIIEDNNRSVDAPKEERWGTGATIAWPNNVRRYSYIPTYPHGGNGRGKWLKFKKEAVVKTPSEKKYLKVNSKVISSTKYIDAVKVSMNMLAKAGYYFIGYNVQHSGAYGTLKEVPLEQKIETPVAENLMAGIAMGMTMEGEKTVLYFERHDFIYNAIDALVNHVDKIEALSEGQFKFPIIIKAVAGSVKPFYAGLTHTSDLTEQFNTFFSFPTVTPQNADAVYRSYEAAMNYDGPVLIAELKELF